MSAATIVSALKYIGQEERPGNAHNQLIVDWIRAVLPWADNDEIAWCSAFANQVAVDAGLENTGTAAARDWLNVGDPVDDPQIGDVVVLWRQSPTSWKGHVGFFVSRNDQYVYLLGGNQSNRVSIAPYPISRVLGYRRLKKAEQ